MRSLALFAGLCACASPPPRSPSEQLTGVWDRYDADGVLIDRLKLDGAGTFHAIAPAGAFFGDLSNVVGSYWATDNRIRLTGTSVDGYPFDVGFSYYANETQLVRGAYVLDPAYGAEDDARYYEFYYRVTIASITTELDGTFAVDERGVPSFLTWYTDPIWETVKTDGGDWEHAPGAMLLDNGLRFEVIDDRVLGQYDAVHRGIRAPGTWRDTGYIYERAR